MPRQDRPNSRVKDLVDLVLLIDAGGMDEARLARDIEDTFRHRGTHPVPGQLDAPPQFWGPVFEKLAEECSIGRDINEQFGKVRNLCEKLG